MVAALARLRNLLLSQPRLGTLADVAGVALVAAGAALIYTPAGLIVAGVGVLGLSVAADMVRR